MKNIKKQTSSETKPIHRIRHGAVSGSIWRQETDKGPLFNVTFQRAYRKEEEWKYSDSFGRRDLLVVGLIAARAFEWIATQSTKQARQTAEGEKSADDVPY